MERLRELLETNGWAPMWSPVLEAGIVILDNPAVQVPEKYRGWTAYTLRETERLAKGKHDPDTIRFIHSVKVLFDGMILVNWDRG